MILHQGRQDHEDPIMSLSAFISALFASFLSFIAWAKKDALLAAFV
jgi:hypothetical protein